MAHHHRLQLPHVVPLTLYALWMPRDRGKLQLVEVSKIEQQTFEQLQVVDVLLVGEVKLVPQERVQQRLGCMEVGNVSRS